MVFEKSVLQVVNSVVKFETTPKFNNGKLLVECTEEEANKISMKLTQVFDLSHLKCNYYSGTYCFDFN